VAQETGQQETTEQTSGNGESNGGHKNAVRAAAIAAATGATAFAAKKAFSGREQSGGGDDQTQQRNKRGKRGGDESMVGAMITSGWHAAKDSLVPFAEDAAGAAGEWVGREGPDLLRETIVPRFVRGFEKGRRSGSDDTGDSGE
jgi:hypothetical protein